VEDVQHVQIHSIEELSGDNGFRATPLAEAELYRMYRPYRARRAVKARRKAR